jgi:ribokinase
VTCFNIKFLVPHIARPGETITSIAHECFPGGKGANQSVALAKCINRFILSQQQAQTSLSTADNCNDSSTNAAASIMHVGRVGKDGEWLKGVLESHGVDTAGVEVVDDVVEFIF